MLIKGLFTWKEEDPRRRNKFTLGLQAEVSVDGRQNQKCSLGSGALLLGLITIFKQNHRNYQLGITPNKIVGLYCRDYPLTTRRHFFVWFVPSTMIWLAKAVYMVLGSSYYKDLPNSYLGRS